MTFLVVGGFTGLGAAQLDAQQATPWFRLTERILVHGSMLWVAVVLAIVLLREEIDRRTMLLKASSSQYTQLLDKERRKLSATNIILQLKDAYLRLKSDRQSCP